MESIHTATAPAPAGHYAQAMVHAGLVYVAGQLPLDPATRAVVEGDIRVQAERTLRNVEAILLAAGSGLGSLLSVTVYLTDHADWADFNEVFARLLPDHRPARAVVPVPQLRPGCLVEIQAIAAVHDRPPVS